MKDFLMMLMVGVLTFVLAAGYMYWQQRETSPAQTTAGAAVPVPATSANEDGKHLLPSLKDYSPRQYNTMIRPAEFQTTTQDQQPPNDYPTSLESGPGESVPGQ